MGDVFECKRLRAKSTTPIKCGRWAACEGCEHCPDGVRNWNIVSYCWECRVRKRKRRKKNEDD